MKLSPGKQKGLESISNENRVIFATAMDQRGSLKNMIQSYNEKLDPEVSLTNFKKGVSKVLGNHSSSLLLDPEYGWDGAQELNKDVGLIMAYEKTGYDATEKGRLPNLVDYWAVQDLVAQGVHALKLLVYYDHNEEKKYNDIKKACIKRVGDECKQNDLLFILEPVSYSAEGLSSKSDEFAKSKPEIVQFFMEEFSKEEYGVDLLKVEVPVSIYHVEGYDHYENYNPLFTEEEASTLYRVCSEKSQVPFIYLSGGVTNEQFMDTLHFAKKSKSQFCGVLCGRATWKEGISTFAKKGEEAFQEWLSSQGTYNLNQLKNTLEETAVPWTITEDTSVSN